ncbi:Probable alginate O-acetylase AlgI (Alginate biosynthesis protein AlgI), partial [Durusdinium trenchii]
MAIALLIDRYRAPDRSRAGAAEDVTFIAWFPRILAGPIQRVRPFVRELGKRAHPKPAFLALGAQFFLWGLVKKAVVADNLAPFVDRTYAIPDFAVPLELIIATYFFAFQIYCDFSGYTDMARGASLMFGLKLPENFKRPYFSGSIGEFWSRRWHITLADWFRDYVYYPFVGEHRTAFRMYAGIMVVFLLSGIWHAGLGYGIGWGFLIWGVLNGLLIWTERALRAPRRRLAEAVGDGAAGMLYRVFVSVLVFHLILVTWIFFRAGDLSDGMTVLTRIWTTRTPFKQAALFVGIFLVLYAAAVWIVERNLRQIEPETALQKLSAHDGTSVDWLVLGASHALPLNFGDVPDRLQSESGQTMLILAEVGAGPVYSAFVLDRALDELTARRVLFVADSFAFASENWNEARFSDRKLL